MKGKEHSQPDQHADDPSSPHQFIHPSGVPVCRRGQEGWTGREPSLRSSSSGILTTDRWSTIGSWLAYLAHKKRRRIWHGGKVCACPLPPVKGGFFSPYLFIQGGDNSTSSEEESQDLSSQVFPPRLLLVHDASRRCQHNVPKNKKITTI